MLEKRKIKLLLRTLRVNQWIKNLVIFTAIIFNGKLFYPSLFWKAVYAFFIFCLLSSSSYVLNDIIDYPYDRKHPVKRKRPIPAGLIKLQEATFIVFVLSLISLILALFIGVLFFTVAFLFIFLHFLYSLYLKRYPVIDIFSISFSFTLRALAGEVITGYHIPIWLLLTIFFVSLFMATVKRHAELVLHGEQTRLALSYYKGHLLNFLTTTFATTTIISYSFYTYFEKPPFTKTLLSEFVFQHFPSLISRRWMMVTIPFVVYGIARYAQLLYTKEEGEMPEKLITQDKPLMATILLWGLLVIFIIYVL